MTNKLVKMMMVLAIVAGFMGCKDDSSDDTPTTTNTSKSNSELLIGTWLQTAGTVDPGIDFGTGTPITDVYAFMDDCDKDDLIIFKTGGVVTTDEGATKCDPDDEQSYDDTYTISSDENTVSINYDGEIEQITIVSINDTEMVAKTVFEEDGTTYTLTSTFTRQ